MEITPVDYNAELILLVDDDEEIAIPFEKLLRNIGLETNHVVSAPDALKELKRSKQYTYLITDIVMPGMDGLELTKRVKSEHPEGWQEWLSKPSTFAGISFKQTATSQSALQKPPIAGLPPLNPTSPPIARPACDKNMLHMQHVFVTSPKSTSPFNLRWKYVKSLVQTMGTPGSGRHSRKARRFLSTNA